MSGFSNPVTNAAGVLVRTVLKSLNYVAGISGWQVSKMGDAEFNNVTVRGTVIVTDPDGSYVKLADDNPGNGAEVVLNPANLAGHTLVPSRVYTESDPLFGFPYVVVISPVLDASDYASVTVSSGDVSVAQGSLIYLRATQIIKLNTPAIQMGGIIYAKTPASTPDNPATEVWHGLPYNAALATPWADQGGAQVAGKYKINAFNEVKLIGELKAGTKADGTVIATLPVGYRPGKVITIPVAMNPGTLGSMTPLLQVATNGNIACYGMAAAAGPTIYLNGSVPLDA